MNADHRRRRAPARAPSIGRGTAVALGLSMLLHAGVFVYVASVATAPDLGLEFQLPAEVEFGLTEGMTVEAGPLGAEQPPPEEPDPAEPGAEAGEEGPETVDAGVPRDAGPRDAGDRDGGAPADAGPPRERDAGPELVAEGPGEADPEETDEGRGLGGEGPGSLDLPPGAQLALRIDMARIRGSALAPDVRRLLGSIPDWQIVLGGSGLEPVDDLERVLIASPNLQRSRMVLAGRHEGEPGRVREIVARMAEAHGEPAPWSTRHGVPVAPWRDADETERVVAVVGPRHFTVTRPEDLPRLLAMARARAEEEAAEARSQQEEQGEEGDGEDEPPPVSLGADALLSMPAGAALTLEVEGARNFVRGPRGVPARARLVLTERDGGGAELVAEGEYDSPEQAEEARAFWDRARAAYADNLLVAAVGMGSALRNLELSADGATVTARTTLSAQQLRLVMGYVEGQLRQMARARERRLEREGRAPEAAGAPQSP